MPLPRTINKHDFERYYDEKFDEETRKIADEWYRFDSNTQKYILRNLKDTGDREYWDNALPKLRKGFDMLEFDPGLYPGAYVGRSVSEWEASRVLSDPDRIQTYHRVSRYAKTASVQRVERKKKREKRKRERERGKNYKNWKFT